MLRFCLRVIGFVSWVGAGALIVIDGTRSIAAQEIETVSLSTLLGTKIAFIAAHMQDDHPFLWSALSGFLGHLPSSLFFVALGAMALWLGRRPANEFGFDDMA
jgi:hypothetical protein